MFLCDLHHSNGTAGSKPKFILITSQNIAMNTKPSDTCVKELANLRCLFDSCKFNWDKIAANTPAMTCERVQEKR